MNSRKEGVDLSQIRWHLQRLKEAAEKAKKELSCATTTNINLPFITATAEGPKHFDMTLTRAKFDELTHDLVEKTAEPVKNALEGCRSYSFRTLKGIIGWWFYTYPGCTG